MEKRLNARWGYTKEELALIVWSEQTGKRTSKRERAVRKTWRWLCQFTMLSTVAVCSFVVGLVLGDEMTIVEGVKACIPVIAMGLPFWDRMDNVPRWYRKMM